MTYNDLYSSETGHCYLPKVKFFPRTPAPPPALYAEYVEYASYASYAKYAQYAKYVNTLFHMFLICK